jgi:tRNA threonylcarbamoyladenosine modification (KEOPS) complex  Pcc1 subunit
MHEATLKLVCKRPKIVMKSLKPDIKNSADSHITMKTDKNLIIIDIKSEKLSHMKAIVNSYISMVAALKDMKKLE